MLTRIRSFSKTEDGFGLIELLVVIVVIGLIAAIAVPIFLDQKKLSVDATVKSDVRNSIAKINTASAIDPTTDPSTVAPVQTTGLGSAETVKVVKDGVAGNYIVYGYATTGKKLTSTDKAYIFKSSTGQFSTGSTTAFAAGTGTATPPTGAGNGYAATVANASLNDGISTILRNRTYSTGGFSLGGGDFQPANSTGPITGSQPIVNGLLPYNSTTTTWYHSWELNDRDVTLFDKNNTQVGLFRDCVVEAYWLSAATHGSTFGYTGTGTTFVVTDVDCSGKGAVLTSAQAALLNGGKVTYTSPEGANTFSITSNVAYQPAN